MNRTIQRAVKILDIISMHKEGLTLKDITSLVNIPKSSAFDILQTLLSEKFIEASRYNNKLYVLGSKAFTVGIRYVNDLDLIQIASPYIDSLTDELEITGFIAKLDGSEIIYLYKHEGLNCKLATCSIGTRAGIYYTSLGKAILAFYEHHVQENLINSMEFQTLTSRTIANKEAFYKNLQLTKQRGYSCEDRESEEHRICFGAPIFDYTGKVIAAISVSDLYDPNYSYEEIGPRVKQAALQISRRLGYVPTPAYC